MDGTIDLDTNSFRMSLYTSAAPVTTLTLSTRTQLSGAGYEVTEQFGYSSSGKALTGVTWAAGASATEMRFDATAVVWTASGGSISNVKFAVIWQAGGLLLCYSQLSTAPFTVTSGNTLTITPSANGIFELN